LVAWSGRRYKHLPDRRATYVTGGSGRRFGTACRHSSSRREIIPVAIGDAELWKGRCVTRGQLAVFAVVTYATFGGLLTGVTMRGQGQGREIATLQGQAAAQEKLTAVSHQETMEALKELHHDLKMLTEELIQANKDEPKGGTP